MSKDDVERKDNISLVYEGGLSDLGKIHLYEYGRALYAFSRLVAVVEYYRRSGLVVEKIYKKANVDVIVSAPEKGSFWVDALILVAGQALPQLKDIPFDVFFSFIVDVLAPKEEEKEERILELAKIQLAEVRERTKQSKEETERIRLFTNAIKAQALTTSQALKTIDWALKSRNVAVGRAEFSQQELGALGEEYHSRFLREKKIEKYKKSLERISADDLQKLTNRVRPLISEIGLPLRKSAKRISFTSGKSKEQRIIGLDSEEISKLNEKNIESGIIELPVRFKAYDRENGWGKVRLLATGEIIPCVVPMSERRKLVPKIARALTSGEENTILANKIINRGGGITSLILIDVGDV